MAGSNSTASERVATFGKIQSTAIDELFNLRALALAGEAMAHDGDDDMLNMGRVMKKIADCAMQLIREIDVVLPEERGAHHV